MIRSGSEVWVHRLLAAFTYWVAVPATVLGVGHGVDYGLGLPGMRWVGLRIALGVALAASGVALIAWATQNLLLLGHGTPSPADPPRELVTSGAYAWCRHPMFLGYDLTALGVILAIGSWGSLLFSCPLFLGLEVYFLRREEAGLRRRFGPAYESYRRRTPLLIPYLARSR